MADREDHRLVELLYDEVSPGTDRASVRDALRRREGEGRELAELEATLGVIRSVPDDDPPAFLDAKILAEARRAAEANGGRWSRWLRALSRPTAGLAVAGAVAACVALFLLPTLRSPAMRHESDIDPYASSAPGSPAADEASPSPSSSTGNEYRAAIPPSAAADAEPLAESELDDEREGRRSKARARPSRRPAARRRLRSSPEPSAAPIAKAATEEDKPRAVFEMPAEAPSAPRESDDSGARGAGADDDASSAPALLAEKKNADLRKLARKDTAPRVGDAIGSAGRLKGADGMIAGGAKDEAAAASGASTKTKASSPRSTAPASAKGEARSAREEATKPGPSAPAEEAADRIAPADRPQRPAPADQPVKIEAPGKADARLPPAVRAARAQLALAQREMAKGRPAAARAAFDRAVGGLRQSQPRVPQEEGRALVRYAEFELGQARYDRARVLARAALGLRGFTNRPAAQRVIDRANAAAR